MAKFVKMAERQLRRLALVEHHVGDAVDVTMGGNGDGRHRVVMLDRGIDEDQTLRLRGPPAGAHTAPPARAYGDDAR